MIQYLKADVIKPLSCGARVWFETKAAVEVVT